MTEEERVDRYRKKPVVIEAMRWDGTAEKATPVIDWILAGGGTARWHEAVPPRLHSVACGCDGRGIVPGDRQAVPCPETEPKGPGDPEHLAIDTLEGTMRADVGDWIIRGVAGEFYPCKPDIFAATYEPAGVLGGVPGEKVTVDRALLLSLTEGHEMSVTMDDGERRCWAWGRHARWPCRWTHLRALADPELGGRIAALGGDGGTRPKGTQRFKPETMERMARHMERDQRYDGSPITTDPATEQEKGRMK